MFTYGDFQHGSAHKSDNMFGNTFRLTKVAKDWPCNSCNITFSQQFNNPLRKKEQCVIPFAFWLMPYTIQV